MSNSYFRFKQFTVHQERCAMKVCTDACLFGAWAGRKAAQPPLRDGSVLDIGTGTGLLSLMLAQQGNHRIDAVELDEKAAEQAAENFDTSPWRERLQVITGDITKLHLGKKYDCIITNPPFFENDLKSPDSQRNLALHSEALSFAELLAACAQYLLEDGKLAVLLPYHRKDVFVQQALQAGFFLEEEISVRQTPRHAYFRAMLWMGRTASVTPLQTSLTIREGEIYSAAFSDLLRDYYLK